MTPRKEVADRKVRWPQVLACGCYVTGGRETRLGGRWICQPCALARVMAERPRPGRVGQDDDATGEAAR